MGWGDELMAAGEARRRHAATGQPVAIVGAAGEARWSELWSGLPYILRAPTRGCDVVRNGPNARPYIQGKSDTHWAWRPYKPAPAEIRFTDAELAWREAARGMVLIEPNVKRQQHANKDWGWSRWLQLAQVIGQPIAQMAPPNAAELPGATIIRPPTFRHALAVLSGARAIITSEGGLHHGAAAVGVPAVVTFGGFIHPQSTGYDTHRNLVGDPVACGSRLPCRHCANAMARITVEQVLGALKEVT
jgi:hypothetical protein